MEQEYNKFLKYLYEGVYVVDKNRKIIFWNEGSEAITGYSKEEVVNNNCYNNILRHVDENGKPGPPIEKSGGLWDVYYYKYIITKY